MATTLVGAKSTIDSIQCRQTQDASIPYLASQIISSAIADQPKKWAYRPHLWGHAFEAFLRGCTDYYQKCPLNKTERRRMQMLFNYSVFKRDPTHLDWIMEKLWGSQKYVTGSAVIYPVQKVYGYELHVANSLAEVAMNYGSQLDKLKAMTEGYYNGYNHSCNIRFLSISTGKILERQLSPKMIIPYPRLTELM